MKNLYYKILSACFIAAILSAACVRDEGMAPEGESHVVYPEIHVGVSELTMNEMSRATSPMDPDEEKYIRTMAIFEFDNEGMHENGPNTYHFIDFVKGTVDDVYGVGDVDSTEFGVVETTLRGLSLEAYSDGMICIVANVNKDQVDEFYDLYREPGQTYGRMTFNNFQTWALPFEYKETESGVYDESVSGHIETMYFFGYYEGNIDPASPESISIDLGRLASRLDITISNETGETIDKRFGYHFDNVCDSAYFFPIKSRLPHMSPVGRSRTVVCTGVSDPLAGTVVTPVPEVFKADTTHTRYFYVAAHSAKDFSEATKLHLFYNHRIVDDDPSGYIGGVKIPMCNVHPSEAADVVNGYSLSRNTRYHFTIRLRKRTQVQERTRSVEYGEQPGDIIVYLPL